MKIIKVAASFITASVSVWLATSFVAYELNPSKWDADLRLSTVLFVSGITLIVLGVLGIKTPGESK